MFLFKNLVNSLYVMYMGYRQEFGFSSQTKNLFIKKIIFSVDRVLSSWNGHFFFLFLLLFLAQKYISYMYYVMDVYIISVSLNYVLFFQFVSCNEEKVFFFCIIFIPLSLMGSGRDKTTKKLIYMETVVKKINYFFICVSIEVFYDFIGI